MVAGVEGEESLPKDEYYELLFLMEKVNKFQPREQWIIPIAQTNFAKDLKTQLLVAIEDYEEERLILSLWKFMGYYGISWDGMGIYAHLR